MSVSWVVLQILCSVTNHNLMINASALLLWVSTCLCPCLLRACPCLPFCPLKRHRTQQRHRASPSTYASGERHMAFPQCTCRKKKKRGFLDLGKARGWPRLDEKKNHIFHCFAWNLACNFKVSFKYRRLHCTGLELPKLLMDSGGLDTARKGLPRHRKAENYFLGERMHHQQHPRTGPRSSFSCFLLLKGFFAAVLQRMGLHKCRTTAASCVEHRIWNCSDTLQRSVKYQLSKPPAFAGCLNNCWGRLAGILPMGKWEYCEGPTFPPPGQMSQE